MFETIEVGDKVMFVKSSRGSIEAVQEVQADRFKAADRWFRKADGNPTTGSFLTGYVTVYNVR